MAQAHGMTGIPYNTSLFYCYSCTLRMCLRCRAEHDHTHSKFMLRITYVRWQKIMRDTPPTAKCQRCLEVNKCRFECNENDLTLCTPCFGESAWLQEALQSHSSKQATHNEFKYLLPPYEQVSDLRPGPCDCHTDPNCVLHCDYCGKGKVYSPSFSNIVNY